MSKVIKNGTIVTADLTYKSDVLIEDGKIDPSAVITHRLPLEQAPEGYDLFREKKDGCIKVILYPHGVPA